MSLLDQHQLNLNDYLQCIKLPRPQSINPYHLRLLGGTLEHMHSTYAALSFYNLSEIITDMIFPHRIQSDIWQMGLLQGTNLRR